VNVKVFAADQIDSSSALPGDPVVNAGQSSAVAGIRGRYFQFQVEVTALADSTLGEQANIQSITTVINTQTQSEIVSGHSDTHSGTTAERIVPITKTYSKILALQGTALYDGTGQDSAGGVGTGESLLDPSLQYIEVGESDGADYVEDSYILQGGSDQADDSEIPVVVIRSLADATQPKYTVFTTNGTNRDHYVYLTVTGLPECRSDADGNIVEVA
jgi:hypothetical protein